MNILTKQKPIKTDFFIWVSDKALTQQRFKDLVDTVEDFFHVQLIDGVPIAPSIKLFLASKINRERK